MKKSVLVILVIATVISASAQKHFELDATAKFGYYFPVNETHLPDTYFPKNDFSPAAGLSLGYNFLKSTGIFLGVEYCYLSPEMIDYTGNPIDVTWQSLNVPLNIQQGIGKNFFVNGGVTLIKQLKGNYTGIFEPQKVPEYNWQLGVGYKLKDLRISLQYYRGFDNINKSTKVSDNEWFSSEIRHQEVFVKFEYPIWKF